LGNRLRPCRLGGTVGTLNGNFPGKTGECCLNTAPHSLRLLRCTRTYSENEQRVGGPLQMGVHSGRLNSRNMAALALVMSLVAGCAETLPDPNMQIIAGSIEKTPQMLPGVPNGFDCPLVPNGFDPAGSIYRLDKSGTFYRVTAYGEEPAILDMKGYRRDIRIADYAFTDEQKSTAGVSFAVLQNVLPGLTASANADFKKNLKIDVLVSDMRAESIDDRVADYILERFRQDVKPRSGSKYFLVRETIRAGAISYSLKREDLAKLGSEAELEKLASGKADVTIKDNNGLLSITQTFTPERVPVCVKPAEIVIEKNRSDGVALTLKDPRDTELPAINKIGADEAQKKI
jgi:hypothetical protein